MSEDSALDIEEELKRVLDFQEKERVEMQNKVKSFATQLQVGVVLYYFSFIYTNNYHTFSRLLLSTQIGRYPTHEICLIVISLSVVMFGIIGILDNKLMIVEILFDYS